MKFASAACKVDRLDAALTRLCDEAEQGLGGLRPDLSIVFVTSHFEDDVETVVKGIVRRYPAAALLGCTAEGVIGPGRELERLPGLSLMLASLPGVHLSPFSLAPEQLAAIEDPAVWARALGVDPAEQPTFIFFGDPFSTPVNAVLNLFNQTYPGRPVLGGMASGSEQPGQSVLIADDQIHKEGVVGLAMAGPIDVQAVVSQGCRPIGNPLVITRCDRHVIHELGGRPALERLQEIVQQLAPEDRKLARQAMFVGRVINEYKDRFGRGDFLIRNLFGIDPNSGAIAVGEEMRVGATIQFHVRDAVSADEDLRQMLSDASGPDGALLFSCNGRGTRMWREPNHDVSVLQELCGPIPVAGFFAAGEIGPIGGRNFIHGHTASIALFSKRPMP